MAELSVVCSVLSPTGPLNLEDGINFEIEKGTMEEVQVAWRKQEVSNPWVEGTYLTGAVKENVMRPLNVWVLGATEVKVRQNLDKLKAALEQLSYTLTFGLTGATSTWRCQVADYTVRREQGFLAARTALVRASVPTLPTPIS